MLRCSVTTLGLILDRIEDYQRIGLEASLEFELMWMYINPSNWESLSRMMTVQIAGWLSNTRDSIFYFGCGRLGHVVNGGSNVSTTKTGPLDLLRAFGSWMKPNGTRSGDTKWQPFNQASNNDRNIHVPQVEEKED